MSEQNEERIAAAFESWASDPLHSERLSLYKLKNGASADTITHLVAYGFKSAIAQGEQERRQLQDELERVTELGRVQLGRAIKAESELAKHKEANSVVCMNSVGATIHREEPLLTYDTPLYANPDNAKEE